MNLEYYRGNLYSECVESHRLKAYILLLIVAAIWGIAGPIIKFTLGGLPPLLFLTYRFAISTIGAVFSFLIVGVHFPKNPKTVLMLILYGFLTSTVSLGLLFFGLENTTVLDMSLITLMVPLITSAAGVLFLREHVTTREKIGMGIAFVGTIFTVVEPIIENGVNSTRLSGNFLILLYLFATTIPAILAKKLLRAEVAPLTMTNIAFIIGFITILPPTLLKYGFNQTFIGIGTIPLKYILGVVYMALLSGNLAYTLGNKAQKTIEIGEAAVFSYLYPLFSAPLAVIWLGEKIALPFILGAVIIASGVTIAEYKKTRPSLPS